MLDEGGAGAARPARDGSAGTQAAGGAGRAPGTGSGGRAAAGGPGEAGGGSATPTITLDCRWLGIGGAGRVTELLLAGLRAAPPDGTWLLWGDPARIGEAGFPGARVVPWRGDPTRSLGQRDLLRVPRADVVVYLHQVRPLRPGRSVTVIHDTIPLRYGGSRPVRALKGLFLRASARLSDRIVTVSPAARDAIVRDLGVRASRVTVTTLGVDAARVERIRALRGAAGAAGAAAATSGATTARGAAGGVGTTAETGDAARDAGTDRGAAAAAAAAAPPFALYVGRFAPHKNLYRAMRAFALTAFAAAGGRFVLVGGTPGEARDLAAWAATEGLACADVRPACPEAKLDRLIATCRVLVAPSLEEGFGLPAIEAAAAGVPVASSRTGAATTIPADRVAFMDPLDEGSIAGAIDDAASLPPLVDPWAPHHTVATTIVAAVREALEAR